MFTARACLTSIFSLFVSNEHTAMTENKKRKIESEGRVFNSEWTNKYLFTAENLKILCLVCQNMVSVPKEYNLRRHFETNHPNLALLDINEKSLKAESLLASFGSEQNFFKLPSNESATVTRVSFEISRKIAVAGKSFTEREFIKKCMSRVVSLICPNEIKKFENVSLSRTTVQRRIEDIAVNITDQLCQKAMQFSYYFLAIDECTDSTDMVQLLVFVKGIDDNFNVSEELAGMQSMQGRTTGKDTCSAIIDCVTKKLSSDFKKLVGLCFDGAPAMCGKTNGAMALLQEHIG